MASNIRIRHAVAASCLAGALLVAPSSGLAQLALDAPSSVQGEAAPTGLALNRDTPRDADLKAAPSGFRSLAWRASTEELGSENELIRASFPDGYRLAAETAKPCVKTYARPDETKRLGEHEVEFILYSFINNHFFNGHVSLPSLSRQSFEELAAALKTKYGQPATQANGARLTWRWNTVRITLEHAVSGDVDLVYEYLPLSELLGKCMDSMERRLDSTEDAPPAAAPAPSPELLQDL